MKAGENRLGIDCAEIKSSSRDHLQSRAEAAREANPPFRPATAPQPRLIHRALANKYIVMGSTRTGPARHSALTRHHF
jgi:hypothetical protein